MITVLEAQQQIEQRIVPLPSEAVALAHAPGRWLREPVVSTEDLPAFDRSAMDGYAVRVDDPTDEFMVVGEIRAGQAIDLNLSPGEAIRIFTGARLPGAGLRVILQEHVEAGVERIRLTKRAPGLNVRMRGEDAREGDVLLEPGTKLEAAALAVLASVGKVLPLVSREPRILHLTTGDEIVAPEQTPLPGQLRNSNAILISTLCREFGAAAVKNFHAGDNLREMVEILTNEKSETCDMVLISGGSGEGSYDFTGELFRRLGATIHFREVNVRPGKPLMFGTTATRQPVFGLPGNALSHFICFHLFVRRALDRLLERTTNPTVRAVLSVEMPGTQNTRETWWPAQTHWVEDRLSCRPIAWKSSGDITRLPQANALIHVPASTSHLGAGTIVDILPTRSLI